MRRVVRLSNFRGRRHSTAAQPQLNVLIRERTEGAVCSDTGLTYASKYDCALLDGATIDTADCVRVSLLGRGKLGDPAMEVHIRENPRHRWVYYPLMKPMEEAIVMKQ